MNNKVIGVPPGWVRRVVERALLNGKLVLRTPMLVVAAASKVLSGPVSFVSVTYTTTGAVAITLPPASAFVGVELTIMDSGANASAHNITISRAGTDTIVSDSVAQTSVTITSDGVVLKFVAINSTTWKVL